MSFSYGMGSNPTIDYPRLLIGDTDPDDYVFEDQEISSAYRILATVFQSLQRYSASAGRTIPTSNVSYLRVAALLLDALASNRSRLLGVTKLLDVTVGSDGVQKTASSLREQAKTWREVDDESGACMIIEQCTTSFGYIQRVTAQIQRQSIL